MMWRLAIFGITLSLLACIGEGLNINSIERHTSVSKLKQGSPGTALLNICFDEPVEEGVTQYDYVTLEVRVKSSPILDKTFYEYQDEAAEGNCKYFQGDLIDYKSYEVTFISQVWDDTGNSQKNAAATFIIPANFFDDGPISSLKVGDTATAVNSLRLEVSDGDITGWNLCADSVIQENVNSKCDSALGVCYFIEVGEATTYSLCVESNGLGTILKGASLEVAIVSEPEIDPTDVMLTYSYTDDLQKVEVLATMVINSDTPGLEFVPYKPGNEPFEICVSDGDPCEFEYTKANEDINILIVNSGDQKSTLLSFRDYGIIGEEVTTGIIEAHWKKGNELFYGANIIYKDDVGTLLQDSIVDCKEDNPLPDHDTYCFAYFTDLVPASYFVDMHPADDEDLPELGNPLQLPNMLNKIRTNPIKITNDARQKQIMDITLLQDYSHTGDAFKVCYKGSETTSNKTRYEAVIIDETGHWVKLYQPVKVDHLTYCFSPIDLLAPSTPLEINKDSELTVVVVERELSGYEVVASGQAHIELSGLRASKSCEDNINRSSSSILTIAGAAMAGIACLLALVAATFMFVLKNKKNNGDLQYPLACSNIDDRNNSHGLENPISIM